MRKLLLALVLGVTALSATGCSVYTRSSACVWVPGHYDRLGFFHRGHWRC